MTKKEQVRRKKNVYLLGALILIVLACILLLLYKKTADNKQSEACQKWEELSYQIELKESQEGNSELQQGVSVLQAEALRYREMCQE